MKKQDIFHIAKEVGSAYCRRMALPDNHLSRDALAAQFEKAKAVQRATMDYNGIGEALHKLSGLIDNLQRSGAEIRIEMLEPNPLAFQIFDGGVVTAPVCGLLFFGNEQKMFALATKISDQPCLQLGLTFHDIRFLQSQKPKAYIFDLNNPESWGKFTEVLVQFAARDAALYEYDEKGVFERADTRSKPLLKLRK